MKTVLNVLGEPLKEVIVNDKGEPILLDKQEQVLANNLQREFDTKFNALGYEVSITTLTTIMKKITEQKFFEIAPADYVPLRIGDGAWSSNLLTYRSFNLADDFGTGIVNTGVNNARLAAADAGVDSISINVFNWAKSIGWSIMDLQMAAKSGNWDLVTAKEKARKKNWDLGIQKIAFLGLAGNSNILGLYNQSGVTNNTTLITKAIGSMSVTELKTFVAGLMDAYRTNCVRSAWPTHFILPESDWLALSSQASADFPIKSTLELLSDALKLVTRNANFKLLPNAYGDATYNSAYINKQRYVMLNYEEESIRMDLPVDYTSTLANSVDNFSFQNVAFGQFTGVQSYRPLELLYFSY